MNEPKISVIIPLYNAEKYIRECLISVLASKFKDYEVLVVDDCSTDDSVAEVRKLLPHFDGRLKILSTEKNSGGAGIPRNVGIKNAAGKYITFIDNDDMILPDALGNFFETAENFAADVVHTEKFFISNDEFKGKNLQINLAGKAEDLVDEPTLESEDISERIRRDMAREFFILPWGKIYRRDFLLENKIAFPQMRFAEDVTFCFKCLCLAKNYVRIPHVTNIHRYRKGSAAQMIPVTKREGLRVWLNILTKNISMLDEFMGGLEINPDLRCDSLHYYIGLHFGMIENLFKNVKPQDVQRIFFEELKNPELNQSGKNIVAAYLYAERALTR